MDDGGDVLELMVANSDRSRVWFRVPEFQVALERLAARFRLTAGQARVFVPLVLAYEDAQIGRMLCVSAETVRCHTKAILRAAGLADRKAIVRAFLMELARPCARAPDLPCTNTRR